MQCIRQEGHYNETDAESTSQINLRQVTRSAGKANSSSLLILTPMLRSKCTHQKGSKQTSVQTAASIFFLCVHVNWPMFKYFLHGVVKIGCCIDNIESCWNFLSVWGNRFFHSEFFVAVICCLWLFPGCKRFRCKKKCRNGYKRDRNGCRLCKCRGKYYKSWVSLQAEIILNPAGKSISGRSQY